MDQLPHAAVGITVFVSDVILGEPIDEEGSQRLVLTMVGRGIGSLSFDSDADLGDSSRG